MGLWKAQAGLRKGLIGLMMPTEDAHLAYGQFYSCHGVLVQDVL